MQTLGMKRRGKRSALLSMNNSDFAHLLVSQVTFVPRRLQRLQIPPIGVLSYSMCAATFQGVVGVFDVKGIT